MSDPQTSTERLCFGVLGAAKITPDALINPAAASQRAEVVAIAARDTGRARAFAETGRPVGKRSLRGSTKRPSTRSR